MIPVRQGCEMSKLHVAAAGPAHAGGGRPSPAMNAADFFGNVCWIAVLSGGQDSGCGFVPQRAPPRQKPPPALVRCWEASKGRACQADGRGLFFLGVRLAGLAAAERADVPISAARPASQPPRLPPKGGRRRCIRRLRPRHRPCADRRHAAAREMSSARGTSDRTSVCVAANFYACVGCS